MMPGKIGSRVRSRAIRLSRISCFTDRRGMRPASTAARSSPTDVGRNMLRSYYVRRATCDGSRAYVPGATCHVARSHVARGTSHVARMHVNRGTSHVARDMIPPVRPLVYAHRGGALLRPENTLASFDHGHAVGADGFELDVHLSKDGVVVVHHDRTLERTTSGRGALSERTADELAALDAGYWFRPSSRSHGPDFPFRGRGFGVPRLRDVLVRYPGVPLIVELKANDPQLARRTIDDIRDADAVARVVLGSFGWRVLHAARQYEPRIATGASREETRWALYRSWVHWPLGRTAYREFQVPERSGSTTIVSPAFVAHARRAGLPVNVWTVDDADDMRRLIAWGVRGLISDRPDLAVAVVREAAPDRVPGPVSG